VEPVRRGEGAKVGDVAHAPFRVLPAQAFVERRVARRVVLPVAFERAVEKQPAAGGEMPARAGEQAFGDRPRRDVDDVGAEYRNEGHGQTERGQAPVVMAGVEADRRFHIAEFRMRAPRRDAAQMIVVEVGRPPGDRRPLARKGDGVLTGAAADLQHVAGAVQQKCAEHRRNRRVIAVERRGVDPAVVGALPLKFSDLSMGSIN